MLYPQVYIHFSPHLQNVSADMLLLGVVNEISPLDVTVSLPFNMRGSVAISEVSDPITAAVTQEAEKEEVRGGGVEGCTHKFVQFYVLVHLLNSGGSIGEDYSEHSLV